jgi:Family of unknown function (DUF6444)
VVTSLPLRAGLPPDAASWEQTPLIVRQLVIQLLAVIQQQTARIAALEARLAQNSRNSDRPPRLIRCMRNGQPALVHRGNLAPSLGILDIAKGS